MEPVTYSLCNKLGIAGWFIPLCAFPPLFQDQPISLSTARTTTTIAFTVPVTKKYPLTLAFEFQSREARLSDQIVGETGTDENCTGDRPYEEIAEARRTGLGRPIPIQVVVRKAADQVVVMDKVFHSLCVSSHNLENEKTRTIGWLDLAEGEYIATVTNLVEQPGLENVKTRISLSSGERK
jgi:Domain of unknown function (DUF5625)